MELMIDTFVKPLEDNRAVLLENEVSVTNKQKEDLFGTIERIHFFHKNLFSPTLESCNGDVVAFSNAITEMCSDGSFNCYLIYGLDEKACTHRRNLYYRFFMEKITKESGIAFSFSPIQQLARYHLTLIKLLEESHKLPASSDEVSAISRAEQAFKRMIDRVYITRNLSQSSRLY